MRGSEQRYVKYAIIRSARVLDYKSGNGRRKRSFSKKSVRELVLTLINCCGVYQCTVPSFPVFYANGLVATIVLVSRARRGSPRRDSLARETTIVRELRPPILCLTKSAAFLSKICYSG